LEQWADELVLILPAPAFHWGSLLDHHAAHSAMLLAALLFFGPLFLLGVAIPAALAAGLFVAIAITVFAALMLFLYLNRTQCQVTVSMQALTIQWTSTFGSKKREWKRFHL